MPLGLGTATLAWGHNGAGQATRLDHGSSGMWTSYTYDSGGRLSRQETHNGTRRVETLTFTYDKEGRGGDAAMAFSGAAMAGLRGVTPCAWQSAVMGWVQRGLHGVMIGVHGHGAYERWQEGDYVGALLEVLYAGAHSYHSMQSCFAAGTPILMADGTARLIEDIREGDCVLSRSEHGPLSAKRVDELYVRTALLWRLRVGGKEIKTTAEHPFYVRGQGWVACALLRPGDVLRGLGVEEWTAVEAVEQTNEVGTGYNFRVADYHTYFVGCQERGFSVWVHNAKYVAELADLPSI